MSAAKAGTAVAPAVSFSHRSPAVAFWGAVAGFLAAATAVIWWLHARNSRLLGSWHGFLHAAIANNFDRFSVPPENPFFAGEPLPYYWFYHLAGYWLSKVLALDLLHTFHLISWISLAILTIYGGRIGRDCFRSTPAGIAIAWLALAGINPLGPGIAFAKHQLQGAPLSDPHSGAAETIFVSDRMSDDLMTHPLLPAMYVGSDWHYGQNLVWFFDISSRAPALAVLMVLAWLLLTPGGGWARHMAVALMSALLTALSAVVGLAVAGILAAVSLLLLRRDRQMSNALGLSAFVGALLAWPTYYHMFFRLSGEAGAALHHDGLPLAMAAANFLLLFPLALAGMRAMKSASVWLLPVGATGILLLVFAVLIHLPKGNEHSLSNAAQCLLAIPAGGAIAACQNRSRIAAAMALAAFLPVTAGTLLAFGSRPAMPIAVNGTQLMRLPLDGDLQRFYEWARNHTPRETVFLSDPATPVKMSGDVSELPAFTARAQFTDTPNLTTPYRDAAFRHELATHAARGDELAAAERSYLARLRRPLYLVTYQANRTDLVSRLSAQYGAPDFHQGIVAVFRIALLDGAVR